MEPFGCGRVGEQRILVDRTAQSTGRLKSRMIQEIKIFGNSVIKAAVAGERQEISRMTLLVDKVG